MTRLQIAARLRETAYRLLESASELENEAAPLDLTSYAFYEPSPLELRTEALRLYGARRKRDKIMSRELFGEPAWDMLLDLFIASVDGKDLVATSVYSAGDTPPATGKRYLDVLSERGLIFSRLCPTDFRKIFYSLTRTGYAAVGNVLAESIRLRMPKDASRWQVQTTSHKREALSDI
ncbi:hypothetical protein E3U23_02625 [Erythrobacter litoralis]|uniref:hypothetical protein n=1 Tax=Erythrobacter litoralis TaxID=39960 RepID=UPI0024357F31|nr:hypothetical protein [Erythrobacter litoralis]MDG6078088.1 hypothetical protein [Erythrobacter litoralis]